MLEFYVDSEAKLRQLRQCPAGKYLDDFAQWLQSFGYKQRPAQLTLRAAAHFGHWVAEHAVPIEHIDDELIGTFARHLPTCACSHGFQGRGNYHAAGARRFLAHLRTTGTVPPPAVEAVLMAALTKQFRNWMHQHRGVTEGTLANYLPLVEEFLATLGEDTSAYDARQVRDFILAVSSRHGEARTRSTVNAVRMFLRFLAVYGYCSPDLVAAVPGIARWRLASLPRYIDGADIEQLMATCDPTCAAGSRDRAIILLLARLGLRAGDVRDLLVADIDWSRGRFRVIGKGRCESWLPLPQEVGDAVWHYLEHFRPRVDDEHVFLRVYAPFGPLPSSGPISKIVRRAIQRAGIKAPSMGAHVLRHSAATAMLRQGISLDIIGAVLRHRCIESTAHYAKVDAALLHMVTQPWPSDTYAYAFQLLLQFASQKRSAAPSALQLEHIDAPLVLEFLEYLQRVRGNAPRTRNARLTAIKSFMHFVEHRLPSALEQVNRVLAIPYQKTDMRLVDHLTAEQCQVILDNPAPSTRLGIRDRAMLHVSITAGLRVSELVGLRLGDVSFESRYMDLRVSGKGRKNRLLTLWRPVAESCAREGAQTARWKSVPGQAMTLKLKVTASSRGGVGSNRKRTGSPQDDELDSAGSDGEPAIPWRSLKHTGHAAMAVKAMFRSPSWLEAECREVCVR